MNPGNGNQMTEGISEVIRIALWWSEPLKADVQAGC